MSKNQNLPEYDQVIARARDKYQREGITISPDALIFPCRDHAVVQAWLTVPYQEQKQ